ncbi:hypothetical protein L1987_82468 [Smallanthus sonchifolius]|uniref:Uncharacterized protein n=1 Tax=Smallanthus sonchifolius TaxID=185202 RepID=A0ACB8YBG6_9ASTR|nr:hypothetical protein L1987_82468 [Smallanthus sonchifolius]
MHGKPSIFVELRDDLMGFAVIIQSLQEPEEACKISRRRYVIRQREEDEIRMIGIFRRIQFRVSDSYGEAFGMKVSGELQHGCYVALKWT